MILISHRGNLNGVNLNLENNPKHIDDVIKMGFDVEVDIRLNNGVIFLGHDYSKYEISLDWLKKRSDKLWVHCKNVDSIVYLDEFGGDINYFWHQNDVVT